MGGLLQLHTVALIFARAAEVLVRWGWQGWGRTVAGEGVHAAALQHAYGMQQHALCVHVQCMEPVSTYGLNVTYSFMSNTDAEYPYAMQMSALGVLRSINSVEDTLFGLSVTSESKYTPMPNPAMNAAAIKALA